MEINPKYLDPFYGAELLSKLTSFKGFSQEECASVYGIGEVLLFKQNTNVIIEGENSIGFYMILEGFAAVYKAGKEGTADHRLATLSAGKSFGDLSFIDRCPRSATVVADSTLIVFYLDGDVWGKVLDEDHRTAARFYENFALDLARRLRELDEQFVLGQKQLWKFALSRNV